MDVIKIIAAAVAGLALFLYGLQHFSKEVEQAAGPRLRSLLGRLTRTRLHGFITGLLSTAILQSSTSTTVMTIGLVNAGVLTFTNSIAIVIGANIGTTVTTQLVAFKLMDWGAVILSLGFLLSLASQRTAITGKLLFYFGFVFYGLDVVSDVVTPLASDPAIMHYLSTISNPYLAVGIGLMLTAIVQSSSVVTGLAIVLLQSGLLPFDAGVGIVIGSNAGTTITAFLASRGSSQEARRIAWAQILFNLIGVLLFLPALESFAALLKTLPVHQSQQLAAGHLVFNVVTALIFMIALTPFAKLIQRLVRNGG